jgi:uncharacterized Zn-binding protein involved in type VI secretion
MPPAAILGDRITGVDIHIVVTPAGVPVPSPFPFSGPISSACSLNVLINGKPAATAGSAATCTPPHLPREGSFSIPPTNVGVVSTGSLTVLINGKPAARLGDSALTCSDVLPPAVPGAPPPPIPTPSRVMGTAATVIIGG